MNLSPSDQDLHRRQNNVKELLNRHVGQLIAADGILDRVVTKSSEQIINSTKTFYNDTSIADLDLRKDLHVAGKINGVDISDLNQNALLVDEDAIITEHLILSSVTIIKDLNVSGTIGDVHPSNFLTTDQAESISGSKTFKNAEFVGPDQVQDFTVNGLINGVNLSDALTANTDQIISAKYTFDNTVTVQGDVIIDQAINNMYINQYSR